MGRMGTRLYIGVTPVPLVGDTVWAAGARGWVSPPSLSWEAPCGPHGHETRCHPRPSRRRHRVGRMGTRLGVTPVPLIGGTVWAAGARGWVSPPSLSWEALCGLHGHEARCWHGEGTFIIGSRWFSSTHLHA